MKNVFPRTYFRDSAAFVWKSYFRQARTPRSLSNRRCSLKSQIGKKREKNTELREANLLPRNSLILGRFEEKNHKLLGR